jgi:hypothetical protein
VRESEKERKRREGPSSSAEDNESEEFTTKLREWHGRIVTPTAKIQKKHIETMMNTQAVALNK